jgi:hypothetical protein
LVYIIGMTPKVKSVFNFQLLQRKKACLKNCLIY